MYSFAIQTSLSGYNQQMFVFRHLERLHDNKREASSTGGDSRRLIPGDPWELHGVRGVRGAGLYFQDKLINLSGRTDSSVRWHGGVCFDKPATPIMIARTHTDTHKQEKQGQTEPFALMEKKWTEFSRKYVGLI